MSEQPFTESYHVGMLPGRKKPCLYHRSSNEFCCHTTPMAVFTNERLARSFMEHMDVLFRVEPHVGWHGWQVPVGKEQS